MNEGPHPLSLLSSEKMTRERKNEGEEKRRQANPL
jgi:hypothetical protein